MTSNLSEDQSEGSTHTEDPKKSHSAVDREHTILSPQPRRPLKRRFLEATEDNSYCKYYEDPAHIIAFMSTACDIKPIRPCRSDTNLRETMSPRQQKGGRPPHRNDDAVAAASVPLESSEPSTMSPFSFRSKTATPAMRGLTPDSRSSSSGVATPLYRRNLLRNNIQVEPPKPSNDVVEYGRQIISKARDSPGLQDVEMKAIMDALRDLRQAGDEAGIVLQYSLSGILPAAARPRTGLRIGGNIPFDTTGLPRKPTAPPISRPRPDQHFCFDAGLFSDEEEYEYEQIITDLGPYSMPSTTGYWPFLLVEVKSQAKLGTAWVAENQNATGGAVCVNSMEKLLSMIQDGYTEIDSIAFSCTLDAKNADFWVHYRDRENGRFCSVEIQQYWMGDGHQIRRCRDTFKNILDWALETRLPQIRRVLEQISLQPEAKKPKTGSFSS